MNTLHTSSTNSCTPSMLPGSTSVDWEWGNGARIVAKSRTHSSPSLRARRRICCISTEHYIEGGREGEREGVKEGGREGGEEGGREEWNRWREREYM